MKPKKEKALSNSLSVESQLVFTAGKKETLGLTIGLLSFLLIIYLLFRKITMAQSKLLELQQTFKKDYELATKKHDALISQISETLKNSRITPNGHVLTALNEGESTHTLPSGYIMKIERKLEHRSVAEEIIGRSLASNEHVHHIYGPAIDDNRPENLCILDKDQHDIFHTYLQREKKLKGRYPTTAVQKRVLRDHFGGILLEEALAKRQIQFPPIQPRSDKFSADPVW